MSYHERPAEKVAISAQQVASLPIQSKPRPFLFFRLATRYSLFATPIRSHASFHRAPFSRNHSGFADPDHGSVLHDPLRARGTVHGGESGDAGGSAKSRKSLRLGQKPRRAIPRLYQNARAR